MCHLLFMWWKSHSSSAFSLGSLCKWTATACKCWSGVCYMCVSKLWLVEFVGYCWLLGLICVVWFSKICYVLAGWRYYLLRMVLFEDCLELLLYCSQSFKTNHAKVALNLLLLLDILCYSSPARKQIFVCHGESWKCFYKCMDLLNCYISSTFVL